MLQRAGGTMQSRGECCHSEKLQNVQELSGAGKEEVQADTSPDCCREGGS